MIYGVGDSIELLVRAIVWLALVCVILVLLLIFGTAWITWERGALICAAAWMAQCVIWRWLTRGEGRP